MTHVRRVCATLAVLAAAACQQNADPERGAVVADSGCSSVESFSGRTVVGNPEPRPRGLVPVDPTVVEIGQPVWPTVDAVIADESSVRYELSGDGSMGWSARFVQEPRLRESDERVPVSGVCVLQVDLTSVDVRSVEPRISPEATSGVVEVLNFDSGANITQSFIGLRSSTPVVGVQMSTLADGTVLEVTVAQ